MAIDHEVFQSPLSWRYGSAEMRALWSEARRRRLMRTVWLALAEAQHAAGLVTDDQLADLRRTADRIDIARVAEIEAETRHDVMAEIRCWAEQAPLGGAVIHLGATSADITENVDAIRVRDALAIVRGGLVAVLEALASRVDELADVVTVGWTHLQPAAPTTVGYRLAAAARDFVADLADLDATAAALTTKGFKGAVGTSASYAALLADRGTSAAEMEADAAGRLGLTPALVTTQVGSRKDDWRVVSLLAGTAASAANLAFNVRIMQSPPFGEWSEGFAAGQVGSTAMPWKRNPIDAENICSLARYVAALPEVAWHNAADILLERTLDDSANRRLVLPDAFLCVDEILRRTARVVTRLTVDRGAVASALRRFGPFSASEAVLVAAAGRGGDRQVLHEVIRRHALASWSAVEAGGGNPLAELLAAETRITSLVPPDEVRRLVASPELHVGDAPARARAMAAAARSAARSAAVPQVGR